MNDKHAIHSSLWKRIYAALLERVAVRVIFVGPESAPDPRIEKAMRSTEVRPMEPEFFAAIKEFVSLAEEKTRQWSEVIKPRADQAMSAVWEKLWKTPEGRRYQELKAEVEKRKSDCDRLCKVAEEGVTRKLLSTGKVVTFLKTHVVVGNADLVEQARHDVERLKHELTAAKERLKKLEKGQEDQLERLNALVVEQIKQPAKPKPAERELEWVRRAGFGEVQEALVLNAQIEDLIADEMSAVDGIMDEFLATLENLAAEELTPEELNAVAPEDEDEVPAEVDALAP